MYQKSLVNKARRSSEYLLKKKKQTYSAVPDVT